MSAYNEWGKETQSQHLSAVVLVGSEERGMSQRGGQAPSGQLVSPGRRRKSTEEIGEGTMWANICKGPDSDDFRLCGAL